MYLNFYDLHHDPFSITAAPDMLFLSVRHKVALQAIIEGITTGQEFIALLGEPGLGKTFLLQAALAHNDLQHIKVIHIFYPKLSAYDILKMIYWELGGESATQDAEQLTTAFYHALLAEHERGQQVVLVLDEADTVPIEALERLLWLAHLRTSTDKPLLQIVLAGLPTFWHHGNGALLRSFKKGLATRLTLTPLTYTESLAYIRHRLQQAGAAADTVFTAEAVQKVARYARGNPRVMNVLCTNLLITGFLAQQKLIPASLALDVIAAYRARNASRQWRRGVAYAAGVLVVAGLAGAFQYERLVVSERGSHLLAPLTGLQELTSADVAQQPVTMEASLLLTGLLSPSFREEAPPPLAPPDEVSMPSEEVIALSAPPESSAPPQTLTPTTGALQMATQDVLSPLVTAPPEGPVMGSEQPTVLQEPPPPVAPSKTVRVVERPQKSLPRRGMSRDAAAPPLLRTPSPVHAARGDEAPSGTEQSAERDLAVAPERSAARPESAPLAVPAKPPRGPERLNPRAVQKDSRAAPPARAAVVSQDRAQPAAPVSHVGSPAPLWPEGTPRMVVEAGGHVAMIRELLFTADGRELVSISDDKTIRVWAVSPDGRHATLARTIRGYIGEGREGTLATATLSPPEADGRQRWLAVGGIFAGTPNETYAIRLHDYASGEVVALLCGHTDVILALAFSPAGRWLASAGKDGTIRLWDLAALQGQILTQTPLVLTEHTDHIYDLAWSAMGDRLASASYDRTIGLWDTAQLVQHHVPLVARIRGHDDQVQTVAFHPDSTVLASGGKDQTIRLWQARDGAALGVFARPQHKVSALAFAPDGARLLAGNFSPPQPDRLPLLAYPSGKTEQVFTGHQNVVVATAFHPSGHWVATGGGEHKEILLWQVRTGEILSRLEGVGRTIYAVGFAPDGRSLSWGHTAAYVSPNRQGPLEHRFDLTQLTRLPGGFTAASPVQALERLGTLSLALEPGGPYRHNSRLHVQDGARRLSTIARGHTDGYRHSAYTFTPDGRGVLSGGLNGVLQLYTLDGTLRVDLVGHTGEIKAVAVSVDGRWVLSGANDQTLCLWSLPHALPDGPAELRPALTLFPAQDGEWVAWTPEGYFVASARGIRLIGASINQGLDKRAAYISGEQLRERFYRPELIQARLHVEPQTSPQNTVLLRPNP
jgi:WD40 repeat protein/type II secretory pathway predicted ATPase ExeA